MSQEGPRVDDTISIGAVYRSTVRRAAFVNALQSAQSKTGLITARAAALRININTDGPLTATRKRWRSSDKFCAPLLFPLPFLSHFHQSVTECMGVQHSFPR